MKSIALAALFALTACAGLHVKATCSAEVDGKSVEGTLSPDGKVCTASIEFNTAKSLHMVKLKQP